MTGANKEMPVALDDAGDIAMTLRAVLVDVLGLDATRVAGFTEVTPLFGALPDFDSMDLAGLLPHLEARLRILLGALYFDAGILETCISLLSFPRTKGLR